MLEKIDRDLLSSVARYLRRVERLATDDEPEEPTPLGAVISEHLGSDAAQAPLLTEPISEHRFIDADIALAEMAGTGRLIGVTGGEQRFHVSVVELMANRHVRFAPGPVSYEARATGPDTERRVVAFGVRLFHFGGDPIAVVQRAAAHRYGRETGQFEILCADPEVAGRVVIELRRSMVERSVLRGKVLSFTPTQFGAEAGATFLPRPDVPEEAVVLEPGVLDAIVAHVVGIGEQREALLAAGQHLKRGVLLYGPPGTGKTLTVRHLLSRTPDATAVVLTGPGIQFITQAAEIARMFAPAIVVLEDVDLVAMERGSSPQPLLFEVLDALDGLNADADVAFVMTTNRVEVLERALAERPGRVDLGVEVPLPDASSRRRLFHRYAAGLPFSDAALDAAADRAESTTGSFAKELMRRSVLAAALRDAEAVPTDDDLSAALDELLSSSAALTRQLLGSGAEEDAAEDPDEEHLVADFRR